MSEANSSSPTSLKLFFIFCRIALTSFGGGLSGWLLREFVEDRKWLSEAEFLNGLSISQAMPGVNVKNMAIWIGFHLLGFRGAAAGLLGIVVPPAILIVLLGTLFSSLSRFPLTHVLLIGAAAAAVGLSFSMGVTTALRVPRQVIPILIMIAVFLAVAIFHVPLLWTFLAATIISISLTHVSR